MNILVVVSLSSILSFENVGGFAIGGDDRLFDFALTETDMEIAVLAPAGAPRVGRDPVVLLLLRSRVDRRSPAEQTNRMVSSQIGVPRILSIVARAAAPIDT